MWTCPGNVEVAKLLNGTEKWFHKSKMWIPQNLKGKMWIPQIQKEKMWSPQIQKEKMWIPQKESLLNPLSRKSRCGIAAIQNRNHAEIKHCRFFWSSTIQTNSYRLH